MILTTLFNSLFFLCRSDDLKLECLRYTKAKVKNEDSTNSKQDSSSGIESGSSRSGSGTSSPVSFDEKPTMPVAVAAAAVQAESVLKLHKIKILGQSINTCVEQDQVASTFSHLFPSVNGKRFS